MRIKELIERLQEINDNVGNLDVVCAYGSGEYVSPQFRCASIYRHTHPSYIVPSYSDNPSRMTEQKPTEALILGLA